MFSFFNRNLKKKASHDIMALQRVRAQALKDLIHYDRAMTGDPRSTVQMKDEVAPIDPVQAIKNVQVAPEKPAATQEKPVLTFEEQCLESFKPYARSKKLSLRKGRDQRFENAETQAAWLEWQDREKSKTAKEMALIIKKLSSELSKADPDNALSEKAITHLKKKSLLPEPVAKKEDGSNDD